jgi:hypothetical protein
MRSVVLGLCVLAGAGSLARAQSVVRGSVRIDSTSRPVIGAEISVEGATLTTTTGATGDFLLGGIGAGRTTVLVRAIGFRPLRAEVLLSGVDTLDVDIRLTPLAHQLATLEVVGTRPRSVSGRMEDFERRRRMGFGRFYTRADLAKLETESMVNVLRRTAGVRLVLLPFSCGNGFAIATNRRANVPMTPAMNCDRGPPNEACYLDIYIDGANVWRWGDGPPLDIEQFTVRDYQAIEVYRGRSELPIEYSRAEPACGAVMMWTRTGEP